MSLQKRIKKREKRRVFRVRNKFASRGEKLRISIHRTAKHVYAQIIDDAQQKTVVSSSTHQLAKATGDKKEKAKQVGIELGKKAVEAGIKDVYFDRGGFLYHGRVRALADGLREGGLKF